MKTLTAVSRRLTVAPVAMVPPVAAVGAPQHRGEWRDN
jgi:hypothetical protein